MLQKVLPSATHSHGAGTFRGGSSSSAWRLTTRLPALIRQESQACEGFITHVPYTVVRPNESKPVREEKFAMSQTGAIYQGGMCKSLGTLWLPKNQRVCLSV